MLDYRYVNVTATLEQFCELRTNCVLCPISACALLFTVIGDTMKTL